MLTEAQNLGMAYMNVFESTLPYVKAPVQIIPTVAKAEYDALYTRWNPLEDFAPGFFFAGDYAHQWNERLTCHPTPSAGRSVTSFNRSSLPEAVLHVSVFQGDDLRLPASKSLIRCSMKDRPCFWATGSNGSSPSSTPTSNRIRSFLNMAISQRDTLSFHYWHIRADKEKQSNPVWTSR